jgi:hypothetical protein
MKAEHKRPALSMEEMLKKYPNMIDGNKKLEKKGLSAFIIPASERLSGDELRKRFGVSDTKQQILNVDEEEMRKAFEDLKKKLAWPKR